MECLYHTLEHTHYVLVYIIDIILLSTDDDIIHGG